MNANPSVTIRTAHLLEPWRSRFASNTGRAGLVGLTAAVLYGIWAIRYLMRHSIYDLAAIGTQFLAQGQGSSTTIDALAPHAIEGGYDGQFALYIALDPAEAHHYIDTPTYRLSRILYPIAARVLAVGQAGAIPWMLLFINIGAVVFGSFALALLLVRRNVSPWLALLFGASPALWIAVDRDITEPLAYALVIGALLALDSQRWLTSGLIFGLAGLTRETTLLFPLALIIMAAWGLGVKRRRPDELMLFGALAFGPYIWLRVALYAWLGSDPPPGPPSLSWPPFSGLSGNAAQSQYEQLLAVVFPGFLALAAALLFLHGRRKWMILPLALNVLVLIVLLPEPSYATFQSSGRISLGVVVAFALCLPDLPNQRRTASVVAPALLWFTPWYDFFPIAFIS